MDQNNDQLTQILERLQKLETENQELRQRQKEQELASQPPGHLVAGDASIGTHPAAARHVVVATNPVLDAPNDPLWAHLHKVDPGTLALPKRD